MLTLGEMLSDRFTCPVYCNLIYSISHLYFNFMKILMMTYKVIIRFF